MIKINYKIHFLFFLLFLAVFFGCTSENNNQIEKVNVDKIKLVLDFKRFDVDLFKAINAEQVLALEKEYPDFYPVYIYQIMGGISSNAKTTPMEAAQNLINNFTSVPDFGLWLKNRTDTMFPTLEPFKLDLTEAMKRYKYFYPEDTIPQFVFFLSPLIINFPVIQGRNIMGIGLDMYLGSDFKVYHSFMLADQFPNYRIRKMREDYMLRDLITAMAENKIKSMDKNHRLIDEMLYEGKVLYMVDAILPESSDSIKLGYTPKQLNWANQNESEVWAALVDSKLLYSTEPAKIRDFISDGPFTTANGFGAGTAPRIGAYTGWQIIKKFMQKNSGFTLAQLLANTDSDAILTQSKYKP